MCSSLLSHDQRPQTSQLHAKCIQNVVLRTVDLTNTESRASVLCYEPTRYDKKRAVRSESQPSEEGAQTLIRPHSELLYTSTLQKCTNKLLLTSVAMKKDQSL